MTQPTRARKSDDPALRADIEAQRRNGHAVNRREMAAKHGVTESAVRTAVLEINASLGSERPRSRPGGRTVTDFSGRQLHDFRHWARLKQDQLGTMAKVSRGEIGHLELGHRKPTLVTLANLESALGIPAGWLQGMRDDAGKAVLDDEGRVRPHPDHEQHVTEYRAALETSDAVEAYG